MIKGSLFGEEELKRKPIVEKVYIRDERFVVVALEPMFNDVSQKEDTTQEIVDTTKINEAIAQDNRVRVVDFKVLFEDEKKANTEEFKNYTDLTTKIANLAKDFAKAKDENEKKNLEQQKLQFMNSMDTISSKIIKKKLDVFAAERAKQLDEELSKIKDEQKRKLDEEEEKKKQREREQQLAARRRNSGTSRGSSRNGSKVSSPTGLSASLLIPDFEEEEKMAESKTKEIEEFYAKKIEEFEKKHRVNPICCVVLLNILETASQIENFMESGMTIDALFSVKRAKKTCPRPMTDREKQEAAKNLMNNTLSAADPKAAGGKKPAAPAAPAKPAAGAAGKGKKVEKKKKVVTLEIGKQALMSQLRKLITEKRENNLACAQRCVMLCEIPYIEFDYDAEFESFEDPEKDFEEESKRVAGTILKIVYDFLDQMREHKTTKQKPEMIPRVKIPSLASNSTNYMNELISNIPQDKISVPIVLFTLLEQIVRKFEQEGANNVQASPNNEANNKENNEKKKMTAVSNLIETMFKKSNPIISNSSSENEKLLSFNSLNTNFADKQTLLQGKPLAAIEKQLVSLQNFSFMDNYKASLNTDAKHDQKLEEVRYFYNQDQLSLQQNEKNPKKEDFSRQEIELMMIISEFEKVFKENGIPFSFYKNVSNLNASNNNPIQKPNNNPPNPPKTNSPAPNMEMLTDNFVFKEELSSEELKKRMLEGSTLLNSNFSGNSQRFVNFYSDLMDFSFLVVYRPVPVQLFTKTFIRKLFSVEKSCGELNESQNQTTIGHIEQSYGKRCEDNIDFLKKKKKEDEDQQLLLQQQQQAAAAAAAAQAEAEKAAKNAKNPPKTENPPPTQAPPKTENPPQPLLEEKKDEQNKETDPNQSEDNDNLEEVDYEKTELSVQILSSALDDPSCPKTIAKSFDKVENPENKIRYLFEGPGADLLEDETMFFPTDGAILKTSLQYCPKGHENDSEKSDAALLTTVEKEGMIFGIKTDPYAHLDEKKKANKWKSTKFTTNFQDDTMLLVNQIEHMTKNAENTTNTELGTEITYSTKKGLYFNYNTSRNEIFMKYMNQDSKSCNEPKSVDQSSEIVGTGFNFLKKNALNTMTEILKSQREPVAVWNSKLNTMEQVLVMEKERKILLLNNNSTFDNLCIVKYFENDVIQILKSNGETLTRNGGELSPEQQKIYTWIEIKNDGTRTGFKTHDKDFVNLQNSSSNNENTFDLPKLANASNFDPESKATVYTREDLTMKVSFASDSNTSLVQHRDGTRIWCYNEISASQSSPQTLQKTQTPQKKLICLVEVRNFCCLKLSKSEAQNSMSTQIQLQDDQTMFTILDKTINSSNQPTTTNQNSLIAKLESTLGFTNNSQNSPNNEEKKIQISRLRDGHTINVLASSKLIEMIPNSNKILSKKNSGCAFKCPREQCGCYCFDYANGHTKTIDHSGNIFIISGKNGDSVLKYYSPILSKSEKNIHFDKFFEDENVYYKYLNYLILSNHKNKVSQLPVHPIPTKNNKNCSAKTDNATEAVQQQPKMLEKKLVKGKTELTLVNKSPIPPVLPNGKNSHFSLNCEPKCFILKNANMDGYEIRTENSLIPFLEYTEIQKSQNIEKFSMTTNQIFNNSKILNFVFKKQPKCGLKMNSRSMNLKIPKQIEPILNLKKLGSKGIDAKLRIVRELLNFKIPSLKHFGSLENSVEKWKKWKISGVAGPSQEQLTQNKLPEPQPQQQQKEKVLNIEEKDKKPVVASANEKTVSQTPIAPAVATPSITKQPEKKEEKKDDVSSAAPQVNFSDEKAVVSAMKGFTKKNLNLPNYWKEEDSRIFQKKK